VPQSFDIYPQTKSQDPTLNNASVVPCDKFVWPSR